MSKLAVVAVCASITDFETDFHTSAKSAVLPDACKSTLTYASAFLGSRPPTEIAVERFDLISPVRDFTPRLPSDIFLRNSDIGLSSGRLRIASTAALISGVITPKVLIRLSVA